WIPAIQHSDTPVAFMPFNNVGLIKTEGYSTNRRNGGGAINAGFTFQLYIRQHRSLKIGAVYTYMPGKLIEHHWDMVYLNQYVEQVDFSVSKHQVLFYVEYPIKLYDTHRSGK